MKSVTKIHVHQIQFEILFSLERTLAYLAIPDCLHESRDFFEPATLNHVGEVHIGRMIIRWFKPPKICTKQLHNFDMYDLRILSGEAFE